MSTCHLPLHGAAAFFADVIYDKHRLSFSRSQQTYDGGASVMFVRGLEYGKA